jgi:hypothetical protein
VAQYPYAVRRRSPPPSSNRTCGFPASGLPGFLQPTACTGCPAWPGAQSPSLSGVCKPLWNPCPSGTPRRLQRTRIRQGPFAPRELPRFHATMTPSDSCPSPRTVMNSRTQSRPTPKCPPLPGQVSQVPDRSLDARCPHPPRRVRPLPLLVAWRSGIRLHPVRRAGHSRLRFHEAESGSRFRITADVVASSSFAPRVAPTHVESASWRTSNSHDQYLSTDKTCQAWPGAPDRDQNGKS